MSPIRRVLLALAVLAALAAAACGTPPDKELQQAQNAIDGARAAGADRFSPTEFAAAVDALNKARVAVADRDYRLALNHALDARERAQAATKEATDRKAAARRDAERAIAAAADALTDARTRLKSAEAAHAPTTELLSGRDAIADAEAGVQKTRTAFVAGDFAGATEAANRIAAKLRQISQGLDAAASAQATRRRAGPRKK
jgi:hypothetical protein